MATNLSIAQNLRKLAANTADESIHVLAEAIIDHVDLGSYGLYVLNLKLGKFQLITGEFASNVSEFSVNDFGDFVALHKAEYDNIDIYKSYRGNQIIGFIITNNRNIETESTSILIQILPFIYNRRNTERLVNELNKPIPYDIARDTFMLKLRDLAENSSGMQFGAYRTVRRSFLDCLFSWGFNEDPESNNSSLSCSFDQFPALGNLISSNDREPIVELNIHETMPHLVNLSPSLKEVRSFCAVPVEVGESIAGVFSVATSFEYKFSKTEISAFQCIANGIGVSLSNFNLYWAGQSKGAEFEKISSSLVGVEVAQSIRHNIHKAAESIDTNLVSSKKLLTSLNDPLLNDSIANIEKLVAYISDETRSMRDVMSVERVVHHSNMKEISEESKSHLSFQLEKHEIEVELPGKRDTIPIISDLIKHVLHNLLLNSIDAMENTSANKSRKISIKYISQDLKNKKIKYLYRDTGPGLIKPYLEMLHRSKVEDPYADNIKKDMTLGEFIFEKEITTKTGGSGFGLWLCRRMLQYHGGGIEYREPDGDGGVSFELEFCYDLNLLMERNDNQLYYQTDKGKIPLSIDDFLNRRNKKRA